MTSLLHGPPTERAPARLREWTDRGPARAGLLVASVLLLTFAFAPYRQFYLAWVGLAPLLVLAATARSNRRAFGWGWLAGAGFFAINLSWIFRATVPGAIALVMYLGIFWGLFAVVVRWTRLFRFDATRDMRPWRLASVAVLGTAAVWVHMEWIRSPLMTGLVLISREQT